MFSMANEAELRKKILEIHDNDVLTFDSESVLKTIEQISSLVESGRDGTENGPTVDVFTSPEYRVPDTLPSMLHTISRELSCKCSGGNVDELSMEILKLLRSYDWEAKITIILATFVVEYAHFSHVAKLYKNNHLGGLVATLKQITEEFHDNFREMTSKFASIIKESIKVTRVIAEFSNLPSKYISIEVEQMAAAMTLVPTFVYNITKVVVSCASQLTEILGRSEILTETLNYTSFEQYTSSIHVEFEEHLGNCKTYIEAKKQMNYSLKLKLRFDKTAGYSNNQKILQLLLSYKESSLPLVRGLNGNEVGVDDLKGKTVLLFISDLNISEDEIHIITRLYNQSRDKHEFQYEIVWLPIGEMNTEQDEEKLVEFKRKMPWLSLQKSVKPALVRFVKEEWRYSTESSILVTLDERGKVVNPNAFQMLYTWGNAAYPFTKTRELEIWSRREWSLDLLVGGIDERITTWIKEQKVICLYGGEKREWIDSMIERTGEIKERVDIKLEMMYIGHDTSKELIDHVGDRTYCLDAVSTNYFWKRIDSMGRWETHQGARVSNTVRTAMVEVRNIHMVRQSDRGWAVMISQGAGFGSSKIAWGSGNVIVDALNEFDKWEVDVKSKGFVTALNGYLVSLAQTTSESHVCTHCHRPI